MKNLVKILTLSLIVAFISFSCEKEIFIKANPLDNRYVIEGNITNGLPPVVRVTKTGFYYDPINTNTLENLYVHDAIVTISDGVTVIQLEEFCEQEIDPIFVFVSNQDLIAEYLEITVEEAQTYFFSLTDEERKSLILSFYPGLPITCRYIVPIGIEFLGEEGGHYDLKVITPDSVELTSSTTIPEHFYIDSLTYLYSNPEYPEYAKVLVNLTFPPNKVYGHYVKFGSKIQNENYYYGGIGGSVYSDAAFAGSSSLSLPLQYNTRDKEIPIEIKGYFKKGDTASLIWHNIDRATYDFLYSVENDGGASPFSSPTKALTNIKGGMGLWGGYNTSEYSVYLP